MEKMNVSMMSEEALEQAMRELYGKIEALPQRFPMNGLEFSWEERISHDTVTENGEFRIAQNPSLRLISFGSNRDFTYEIGVDGSVKYYSFYSNSGKNDAEAAESMNYYQTCFTLLSDDFRQMLIRDYTGKLDVLNELKSEYKTVSQERERRHDEEVNERKAREEKETTERRNRLESIGQVWYDYGYSNYTRYTVKSVTEKTITFKVCQFSQEENRWVSDFGDYTKRVSKHLLGNKPVRRYRHSDKETVICPVGTDDLQRQKPEQPETVKY